MLGSAPPGAESERIGGERRSTTTAGKFDERDIRAKFSTMLKAWIKTGMFGVVDGLHDRREERGLMVFGPPNLVRFGARDVLSRPKSETAEVIRAACDGIGDVSRSNTTSFRTWPSFTQRGHNSSYLIIIPPFRMSRCPVDECLYHRRIVHQIVLYTEGFSDHGVPQRPERSQSIGQTFASHVARCRLCKACEH